MNSPNSEVELLKLRRQLEEILAMVQEDHNGQAFNRSANEASSSAHHDNDAPAADPALAGDQPEPATDCKPVPIDIGQIDERDPLYDDALVVVTEFGQASPAILQMWLSIDYGRAITILNRLQADGLVSSKGRVRHKAYSLRRSEQSAPNATT
jgi:DNA segregation ATPase FtsK/SpoIIIE-like protein